MLTRRLLTLLVLAGLAFGLLACNLTIPRATPTSLPATMDSFPQTVDDVPRVTAQDAKSAFDNGEAIIVDVRNADAYAAEHIANALSLPLTEIEANPANVSLDKTKWIITYCT